MWINIDNLFINPSQIKDEDEYMRVNDMRIGLIEKKYSKGLKKKEEVKLRKLQCIVAEYIRLCDNKDKSYRRTLDFEIRLPFSSYL